LRKRGSFLICLPWGCEFETAAQLHKITSWHIPPCSACKYECRFIIQLDSKEVEYDAGCYCVRKSPTPSSWKDVAQHYNMQDNSTTIAKMDQFWHFEPRTMEPKKLKLVATQKCIKMMIEDDQSEDVFTIYLPEKWNFRDLFNTTCECKDYKDQVDSLSLTGLKICKHIHYALELPLTITLSECQKMRITPGGISFPFLLNELQDIPKYESRFQHPDGSSLVFNGGSNCLLM